MRGFERGTKATAAAEDGIIRLRELFRKLTHSTGCYEFLLPQWVIPCLVVAACCTTCTGLAAYDGRDGSGAHEIFKTPEGYK